MKVNIYENDGIRPSIPGNRFRSVSSDAHGGKQPAVGPGQYSWERGKDIFAQNNSNKHLPRFDSSVNVSMNIKMDEEDQLPLVSS